MQVFIAIKHVSAPGLDPHGPYEIRSEVVGAFRVESDAEAACDKAEDEDDVLSAEVEEVPLG